MEETLVCNTKYMSPAQENSYWHLDPEVGSIYTTFSLKTILLPKLNIEFVTNTLKLHRGMSTLSQNEVDKKKLNSLTMIMKI